MDRRRLVRSLKWAGTASVVVLVAHFYWLRFYEPIYGEWVTLPSGIVCPPGLLPARMAIPAPSPDAGVRRAAFARMRGLYDALRTHHHALDTLSMGMSDDLELAIAEGATMVRVGTALFGARD